MSLDNLQTFRIETIKHDHIVPTKLYSFAPIGIGTPAVESMSSYLTRLANAHIIPCIKMLRLEILPLLKNLNSPKKTRNPPTSANLRNMNANDTTASDFVRTLEFLTSRTDLTQTTLLPYQDIFSSKHLIRKTRAWCPICLNSFMNEIHQAYEPLSWKIDCINICHIHHCLLEHKCSNCNSIMQHLHNFGKNGFCFNCGSWLGSDNARTNDINATDIILASLLHDIMSMNKLDLSILHRYNLSTLFKIKIDDEFDGNILAFARHYNIRYLDALNLTIRTKTVPLESLLVALTKSDIKFSDLVAGNFQAKPIIYTAEECIKQHNKIDITNAYILLNKIISGESRPIKLIDFCRKYSISYTDLWNENKQLCKQATEVYNNTFKRGIKYNKPSL